MGAWKLAEKHTSQSALLELTSWRGACKRLRGKACRSGKLEYYLCITFFATHGPQNPLLPLFPWAQSFGTQCHRRYPPENIDS